MKNIENFLSHKEHILASYGNYYATNKRIIRYESTILGEKMRDMHYNHINSVYFNSNSRIIIIVLGVILIFMGIIGNQIEMVTGSLIMVMGFIVIILGLFYNYTRYSLVASSGEKWTIDFKNLNSDKRAEEFIAIIREHTK